MLPEGASTFAPHIDRLFWAVFWITLFFFVLVQGGLILFAFRYRARPGRKAAYVHGNNALEIIWTVIPALILLALTVASQKTWAEIRGPEHAPQNARQIRILAEQFAWNVRYPGADGLFETEDDITTINQLHLPVGEPVMLTLESKDVIHSFFVPEFRLKQDAVPGMTNRLWFTLTRPGEFDIRCAELCGLGHYRMRGFATVESPEAFAAWLDEQRPREPETPEEENR